MPFMCSQRPSVHPAGDGNGSRLVVRAHDAPPAMIALDDYATYVARADVEEIPGGRSVWSEGGRVNIQPQRGIWPDDRVARVRAQKVDQFAAVPIGVHLNQGAGEGQRRILIVEDESFGRAVSQVVGAENNRGVRARDNDRAAFFTPHVDADNLTEH